MHVSEKYREKYRLGPRLGVGGMADVFRGELMGAEGFSRPVAIKRLHAAVSSDPAFCAMFVREARLLAALHHTNIVSVLDFDWDGAGGLFLVLELIDGVNLAELVRRGPLPLPVAEHVMTEVLRGLGHAHARGILHRDVTPHNVLLSWTGEVKLGDFGLAQTSSSSRVSDGGLIRGKVPYLSPEQLQGLTIDARSDLFSVGVMAYQLLTGRYPFVGRTDQATMAESIARMLTATIVPPRDLRPEISPALSDVVMRLLERERERRFLSADMVLADMPVPARGRELLVDLLAERFPGGVVEEAGARTRTGTGTGAGAGMARAEGEAADPWLRRHTASLHGVEARPEQAGRHGNPRASRLRWWPGLALVLLMLPLVWVIAHEWPRGTASTAGAPDERMDRAASGPGAVDVGPEVGSTGGRDIGHADAERPASPHAGQHGPRADETGATGATDETGANEVDATAGRASSGSRIEHAGGRAGRSLPRRAPQRMQAAAPSMSDPGAGPVAGPVAGSVAGSVAPGQASAPQPAPPATGAPVPPAERRYEAGWTELKPKPEQALTGEVPIRRREVP